MNAELRWVKDSDSGEIINLFHLARTALAGEDDGRHARMIWASKEFSKLHPDVSSTAAYKDLEALL